MQNIHLKFARVKKKGWDNVLDSEQSCKML